MGIVGSEDAGAMLHKRFAIMTSTEPEPDEYGTRVWRKGYMCHRDNDLPAVVYADGGKQWFRDGVFHRDGDQTARLHGTNMACITAITAPPQCMLMATKNGSKMESVTARTAPQLYGRTAVNPGSNMASCIVTLDQL